jgi:hypothetical protein
VGECKVRKVLVVWDALKRKDFGCCWGLLGFSPVDLNSWAGWVCCLVFSNVWVCISGLMLAWLGWPDVVVWFECTLSCQHEHNLLPPPLLPMSA